MLSTLIKFTGNVLPAAHTINMSHRLLILFAILAIFATTATSHECPPHEVWNECGTACPPTCEKPYPTICTLQCVIGCQCRKGLVRSKCGKCIPPSECK
ncbi:chymotrypsin inhibitor [Ptiloglossa arizonensis]|uniref:chymotrypsin inhibitor n=1 Tax=Ptiloglossa arizonensis TaxID=3350558 RepID=UPI003FA0D024